MSNRAAQIIRKTCSTCHRCRKKIDAYLVEENKKIFMKKSCPEHGDFKLLISRHPWYYKGLTEYYFNVMPEHMKQKRFYIYLSNKCDLTCPICLLNPNQGTIDDIPLDDFKKVIRKNRSSRFYFYGAEPTLHKDIEKWIRLLKKYGNLVNIHTNGINISDFKFLKRLKESGVDYISLQFDGFNNEIYKKLRGRDLLDIKKKALENLKQLNIQTGLNVTIARGINETCIGEIIDYAVNNRFIKDVSFATLSCLGNATARFSSESFMMPDELIDMTEIQTSGRISRQNLYRFQKFYYSLLSALGIRRCYNFQHIPLIRDTKEGFNTFDSLFALKEFEPVLDHYKELVSDSRLKARSYLLGRLFLNIFGKGFFPKLKCVPLNMLIPGKIRNIKFPEKMLMVSFGTVCDYYKYDKDISRYCGQGFCFNDRGKTVLTDSISELTLFSNKEVQDG